MTVLCVCVFVQFQGGVWSLNTLMCDFLMTMDVMLCTASIFNLCAISVDRYVLLTPDCRLCTVSHWPEESKPLICITVFHCVLTLYFQLAHNFL